MSQEEDFEYFQARLPELMKEHEGQFVIVKNKELHGFYVSMEDALKKAYEKFDSSDFIIQEITDIKQVNYLNEAFIYGVMNGAIL